MKLDKGIMTRRHFLKGSTKTATLAGFSIVMRAYAAGIERFAVIGAAVSNDL